MGYINSKKYGTSVQHYKKKNGDIAFYITYKDEYNKLKRLKIGDKSSGVNEQYCYQKRIEILNSIRLGEEPPVLANKKKKKIVTLDDIAEIYFKQKEVHAKDNVKSYQKYSTKLKVYFGQMNIYDITPDKILEYQLKMKKDGLAPATINYTTTFLGTLFNIAIEEELYTKQNPLQSKKIKKLKVDNQRDRYLDTQEIEMLFDKIEDPQVKLFVELSLSTGGRLETILNIQKKDINFKDANISLKDLKNDSTYTGFISANILDNLKKCAKSLVANDYIIGGINTKYPSRTIQRKLKNIFDELFNEGLDTKDAKNRVVTHTLRHTFASHLAINGTPIYTIQKLMNHRDINMTLRYAKLAPDSGKDFVDDLYK